MRTENEQKENAKARAWIAPKGGAMKLGTITASRRRGVPDVLPKPQVLGRAGDFMVKSPGVASSPSDDFLNFVAGRKFATILADPPWQFTNRTGKVAPEHKRLSRYGTMDLEAIKALPVAEVCEPTAHLYLWVPNALLPEGLAVLH